ncbi:MAG TPA: hypothetical protein VHI51_05715 [Ktedonobacterales bacterium]|jgi:hypothetical protein|nr:hypothetical protein [Ktedonobacterales bacterium]
MRCEECGRVLKNAQMWQLGGSVNAPTSRSMRQLCWECRERAAASAGDAVDNAADSSNDILAQADRVVREYESRSA